MRVSFDEGGWGIGRGLYGKGGEGRVVAGIVIA